MNFTAVSVVSAIYLRDSGFVLNWGPSSIRSSTFQPLLPFVTLLLLLRRLDMEQLRRSLLFLLTALVLMESVRRNSGSGSFPFYFCGRGQGVSPAPLFSVHLAPFSHARSRLALCKYGLQELGMVGGCG